jgi:enolase-phosphatase E1
MGVRCVLMDIEGTITSIAFVRQVLFPYAKSRLASFLRANREDYTVRKSVASCLATAAQENGGHADEHALPAILARWIDEDRKHPGLKVLQGLIWDEGYRTGAFAPQLYDDVLPALLRWQEQGISLALYSSGSEHAQRLLIAHTTDGDVTRLFVDFFDTRMGPKTDPASYAKIAGKLGLPPAAILFMSDSETELDAAAAAALITLQIVRPGTTVSARHPARTNFAGLDPNAAFDRSSYTSQTK